MGLGSKLRKRNKATAQALSGASAPVNQAGYNASNIPDLSPMNRMNEDDKYEVNELRAEATNDVGGRTSIGSLRKPDVPHNDDADRLMINGLVVDKMWRIVCINRLENFFTQTSLQDAINRACMHDYRILMRDWNIATIDMACDLAVLGLYDIIFLGDDSGSMAISEADEDDMTRWAVLKILIKTLGFWATLMDADGVLVRMFNNDVGMAGNGVATQDQVEDLFHSVGDPGVTRYRTPMGKAMARILDEAVYDSLSVGDLQRPILLLTITDGCPDSEDDVINTILDCHSRAESSRYGAHAVSFGFCQVGTDSDAQEWLNKIDKDRRVGKLIDCTSNYQMEKKECLQLYGLDLSPSSYLIKGMIGAVDPTYDAMDGEDAGASASTSTSTRASAPPAYRR